MLMGAPNNALVEYCKKNETLDVILKPIEKLRKNIVVYSIAYDHPKAHRASNMIDRLLKRMDHHLFITHYFHESRASIELSIRGWTLIQKSAPSNTRTVQKYNGL